MLDDYEYHLREAGREIEAMERGAASMERQLDRLITENYELKQRIRELEGSLLHCARCGRGIGEDDGPYPGDPTPPGDARATGSD